MSAMFANVRNSTSSSHIVEFKGGFIFAGRCKLEPGSGPTKRKVVCEPTKGTLFIKQSSDQLMHFCWKNRETGAVVDDLIIFPGDTEFKVVNGCPDGAVYMLKFLSSEDRRLFWVQEAEEEKDIVKKVNDALNKPPPQRASNTRERNTTGGGLASLSNSEDIGTLGGLDQSQLMQLLQFMSPGTGGDSGGDSPSALSNLLMGSNRDGSPAAAPSTPTLAAAAHGAGTRQSSTDEPLTETTTENEEVIIDAIDPPAADAPATSNGSNEAEDGDAGVKEPEPKRGKPDDEEMDLD